VLLGLLAAHQAAIGAQQREPAAETFVRKLGPQVRDIFAHHRAHCRVGDGRKRAFVFLHLGQDLVGERNRNAGQFLRRDRADARFVRAVDVGVDEADRQRLDPLAFQLLQHRAHRVLVERADLVPVGTHPARHFERVLEVSERLRLGPDDPCRKAAGHEAARDLHDVAVAFGRDKADLGPLAFEHGIGRDRRAVQEIDHVLERHARLIGDRPDAVQDPFGGILRGRRRLVSPEAPAVLVEQQKVGEGPPDIDAKPVSHAISPVAASAAGMFLGCPRHARGQFAAQHFGETAIGRDRRR